MLMFTHTQLLLSVLFFFFFNDTATTEIYTLSLHDALPIWSRRDPAANRSTRRRDASERMRLQERAQNQLRKRLRSEEHTSELQSQSNLVCRLLLEKKKNIDTRIPHSAHTHTSDPLAQLTIS